MIPDLDALRRAADDPGLPADLADELIRIADVWQPVVDARDRGLAASRWYHVSPHALAPGTVLTPASHRGVPATSQGFYDARGGAIVDAMHPLDGTAAGRDEVVWVTHDLDDAAFWARLLEAGHCYEVEPVDRPRPWNGTGTDGWFTPSAVVVTEVALPGR